uniref:Ig-like domain-containing protein n=1 Tax=Salmo trutta TaxID=8032 RepID=A0A674C7X9_SALTR
MLLFISSLYWSQAMGVLTIQPKSSQILSGESVTLRCNIQRGEVTDWKYTWRKDDVESISRKHEYEISEIKISDSGDYRCLGTHIHQKKHSEWSDAVRLTVTALPTASVKTVTTQETLYSRDTVKLQCELSDYTGWTYHWLINKEGLSRQTSKTTTISLSDQTCQYHCEGTRTRRTQNSYLSSSTSLVINIPLCKINLNQNLSATDKGFKMTKHVSRCFDILLSVFFALPETTLTVNPNPAYTGETVTLTCSVGSDSGWSYTWYKDNTKTVVTLSGRHTTTGATFTISRAAESDQGLYWCQGEIQNGLKHSQTSNAIQLTVLGKSVFMGLKEKDRRDETQLLCGVKESSTGWRSFWYQTVPYTAGLPSLSDRSYSVEPLSGSGTTEDSYTLILTCPSHTGGYVCRAGRGDPVYDTLYSEPQFFWSRVN